jgi:hypothetical protein
MQQQMQSAVLCCRDTFPDSDLTVAFHHGLGSGYQQSEGFSRALQRSQLLFADWLCAQDIACVDISGDARRLIEFYSQCDLHIGYRIHAHIFMSSISKPSVLLVEDGRGVALRDVIGGVNLKAYRKVKVGSVATLMDKIGISFDKMVPRKNFIKDYSSILNYEVHRGVRFSETRDNIRRLYPVMNSFLQALP